MATLNKKFGWPAVIVGVAIAVAAGTALAVWWWYPPKTPQAKTKKPPPILSPLLSGPASDSLAKPATAEASDSEVALAGYLGPQACAECHAERVAALKQSSHFRTCRVPEPADMPPEFETGKATFVTSEPGLRFEMSKQGSDYIYSAVQATPSGEQRASARIDLVYGAGKADDVYLSWRDDDQMFELPASWLYTEKKWGAAHFDHNRGGDFCLEATVRCFECHNTWFHHVPGTLSQYRREGYIMGVTCESCHGPGQEHVAHHRAHPGATTGAAVVHPGKLPRERQIEVCTQCHSNAIRHRGPAMQYRPGKPLDDYYKTLTPKHNEDDHVANQITYLRQSKCFQQSETLTCTTCHDPHRSPGEETSRLVQEACFKCHKSADCGEQEKLPAAVRERCVDCHMRKYVKINVNFQTADDNYVPPTTRSEHRIAIDPTARREVLLGWYRSQTDVASQTEAASLEKELISHWLAKSDEYLGEHRHLAAIGALREALRVAPSAELRDKLQEAVSVQANLDADWNLALRQISQKRLSDATATLESMLKVKPDHAKAHGKLGTLYAMAGNMPAAVEHLEAVTKCDPDDPYGHGMLGWLAYLRGDAREAIEQYRKFDALEPYNAKVIFHLGLAQAKLGRLPEASESFKRVLTIDPKHFEACHSLASVFLQAGKPQEAIPLAERAARLTNFRHLEILALLAEANAQAGRFREAAATAAMAIDVAQTVNPAVVPQIRAKWEEYQAQVQDK